MNDRNADGHVHVEGGHLDQLRAEAFGKGVERADKVWLVVNVGQRTYGLTPYAVGYVREPSRCTAEKQCRRSGMGVFRTNTHTRARSARMSGSRSRYRCMNTLWVS